MSATLIQQLESAVKRANDTIAQHAALERLLENKDFKTIIADGYFRNEAIRLVQTKADPDMQTPERQASIIKDIDAIGSLVNYLRALDWQHQQAEKEKADAESLLESLREEGAEE